MAIDTSVGRQFSVDKIVTMALRKAGLCPAQIPATAEELAEGRDLLELVLDNLQNKGLTAKEVSFQTLTYAAGDTSQTLAATVLDVEGDDAYWGDDELCLYRLGSQLWNERSDKSDQGTPSAFYVAQTADSLTVYLTPVPNAAGSLRLRCRRLLSDVRSGQATLDMERGFSLYLVTALQAELVESKISIALAQPLHRRAAGMLDEALGRSRENVDPEFDFDLGLY